MFDAMSEAVRTAARAGDPRFIFQTQGLFNGHVAGRQLFVYTDYTELANFRVDPQHRGRPERWLRRERKLYEQADVLFAASRDAQISLLEDYGAPPEKVVLVQTGLNVPPPEKVPERDDRAFTILFIGVDWERKGGPDLLRAYDQVRRRVPRATLIVVGCTPSGAAPPGARYLGKLAPGEVAKQLASASVLCLPARQEPAGIAYSEASAWGLPVVATNAGNIPDRVIDGQTGLLVSPGDTTALAEALVRLAGDTELRARLGSAGRTYTLNNFTWPRIAAKITETLGSRVT
jgi:glycosyltransferase involved in cell wall biosynthesis